MDATKASLAPECLAPSRLIEQLNSGALVSAKHLRVYSVFLKAAKLGHRAGNLACDRVFVVAFRKQSLRKVARKVLKKRNGIGAIWRVLEYARAADINVRAAA